MKEKRGFTLIELLAVIVILAIIALIAVPTIMNIIAKANKSAFKDSAYGIIKAGELYYADKLLDVDGMTEDVTFTFPEASGLELKGSRPVSGNMKVTKEGKVAIAISNGKYCVTKSYNDVDVTISEDIENCIIPVLVSNIIVEENIMVNIDETKKVDFTLKPDGVTNTNLKWTGLDESIVTVDNNGNITGVELGDAKITVETQDGSNIKKEINIQVGYKNGIMRSPSNCINEGTCSNGTRVLTEVNNTEKYNFYTIKDESNNLTMIMDRNLGDPVAWISEEDYVKAGGTDWDSKWGRNSKGPLTALKELKSRTDGWTNIPEMTYTLENDDDGYNGSYGYSDISGITARARMITLTEMKSVGCTVSQSDNCPTWLYMNTFNYGDNSNYGYLLSTASSVDYGNGWNFHSNGAIGVGSDVVHFNNRYGLRPVIPVSKNL